MTDVEHVLGVPTGDPAELASLTDDEQASIEGMAALFTAGSRCAPYLANRRQTLAAFSSWTYYNGAAGMPINPTAVLTGVSHGAPGAFRHLAERTNDIVHWSNHRSGSHMVAMAVPGQLVGDVREFFAGLRPGMVST